MNLEFPGAETLADASEHDVAALPRFAVAERERTTTGIEDVAAATRAAVDQIRGFDDCAPGDTVAITAGSRGIQDLPTVLAATVEALQARGLDPFVLPAMGSHGGATADGQRETLSALGVTPASVGCPIRSSMAVEAVAADDRGRPVYAARDALEADAVLLVNRVKPHTDFRGDVESGLAKMAVVGLGKDRGAESLHNAGIATDFAAVIRDRFERLREATPIVGGIAIVENAADRAAHVEGIDAAAILDREPDLLERATRALPELPVEDLDLLVVDEMGKDASGTGMDTNVLGRYAFHGETDPDSPQITRVYVRSLSGPSHGNALGVGLADFVHRDLVADVDLADTYVNIVTSGEPRRAKLPFVVPDDATALVLACSTAGVVDAGELRAARIPSTTDPDSLVVSEPVAADLREHPAVTVGPLEPLSLTDGTLVADPYGDV